MSRAPILQHLALPLGPVQLAHPDTLAYDITGEPKKLGEGLRTGAGSTACKFVNGRLARHMAMR